LASCDRGVDRPPDDPAEAHEGGPGPRLPERGEHAVTMRERGGGVAGTAAARAAAASAATATNLASCFSTSVASSFFFFFFGNWAKF